MRFACAVHSWDKSHDGVAGCGGLGAVTGANHLKVVAVTGNRQTTVAHPNAIKTLRNDIREPMKVGTAGLKNYAENVLSVRFCSFGVITPLRLIYTTIFGIIEGKKTHRLVRSDQVARSSCRHETS